LKLGTRNIFEEAKVSILSDLLQRYPVSIGASRDCMKSIDRLFETLALNGVNALPKATQRKEN
jgi:hypothetical protein